MAKENLIKHLKHILVYGLSNPIVIVGLITLVGGALRLHFIAARSLWLDEAKLYWIAQGTAREVIAQNANLNSAPPLFALLINLVSRINQSEAALRSVSVLAGIMSISAIFLLSRRFVSRYAAYLCALLTAISLSSVTYSLELREYSLSFLVATVMLLAFHRFLYRPDWRNMLFVITASIVGVFTQYGLALLVLSLNFVFIVVVVVDRQVRSKSGKIIRRWIITQIFVLVAVAIVVEISLKDQIMLGGFGASTYLRHAYCTGTFYSIIRLALFNTYEIFDFAFRFPSLVLFFCSLGLLHVFIDSRDRSVILLFVIPMIIAFVAAVLKLYPYYGGRQLMFLVPMIFVFVGLGFDYLFHQAHQEHEVIHRRFLVITTFVIFSVIGLGTTITSYQTNAAHLQQGVVENIRPLIETMTNSFGPNDRVYVGCRASPAFRYYYRENFDRWVIRNDDILDLNAYLERSSTKSGRLWMIFSHCHDPQERQAIVEFVSQFRKVQLVGSDTGAWLYLAQ